MNKLTIGKLSTIEFFFGDCWKVQYWPKECINRKRQYSVRIYYDGKYICSVEAREPTQSKARKLIQQAKKIT